VELDPGGEAVEYKPMTAQPYADGSFLAAWYEHNHFNETWENDYCEWGEVAIRRFDKSGIPLDPAKTVLVDVNGDGGDCILGPLPETRRMDCITSASWGNGKTLVTWVKTMKIFEVIEMSMYSVIDKYGQYVGELHGLALLPDPTGACPEAAAVAQDKFFLAYGRYEYSAGDDCTDCDVFLALVNSADQFDYDHQKVNIAPIAAKAAVDVATLSDGSVVVAWTHWETKDSPTKTIRFRRYAADGTPVDNTSRIAVSVIGQEFFAGVAVEGIPAGGFVLAYKTTLVSADADDFEKLHFKRFDAQGNAVDPAPVLVVEVDSDDVLAFIEPAGISVREDGDFVLGWYHYEEVKGEVVTGGIRFRRYQADASPLGPDYIQVAGYEKCDIPVLRGLGKPGFGMFWEWENELGSKLMAGIIPWEE